MEYEVSRVLTCKLPPHQQDRPGSLSCSVFLIKEKKISFPLQPAMPLPLDAFPPLCLSSLFLFVSSSASHYLPSYSCISKHGLATPPAADFPGVGKKGPPTYLSCCPAPLMLSKKLRSLAPQNGGLHCEKCLLKINFYYKFNYFNGWDRWRCLSKKHL